jgi:uncharacterized protein (UPF0335 family)
MTMGQLGRNTPNGERLVGFIERVEALRERKKEISADESAVMAEARAEGFDPKVMRALIKRRAEKPHDLQEFDSMLDIYSHAAGMDAEAPLFRAVGLMAVDTAARDQVIEAFKRLVPDHGEIIVKAGDKPVRLWRDRDGAVHAEDWQEPQASPPAAPGGGFAPARPGPSPAPAREVPDCSDDEAGEMGKAAFRDNQPVTSNPFPHDDKRRRLWDRGWRDASGTDGMGPAPKGAEGTAAPDPDKAETPKPEDGKPDVAPAAAPGKGKIKPGAKPGAKGGKSAGKAASAKPATGKAAK